jgi:hypothetical protein
VAPASSASCASPWSSPNVTGSALSSSCSIDVNGGVNCSFTYLRMRTHWEAILTAGLAALGIPPPLPVSLAVNASAPNAAFAFRKPLSYTLGFPQTEPERTNGSAAVSVALSVPFGFHNVCSVIAPLLDLSNYNAICNVMANGFWETHTITVAFPALGDASITGAQLAPAVMDGMTPPFSLNPNDPTPGPHRWFFDNQWYRYTYYAIAPGASAAQSGGSLTVNNFPDGTPSNKRFALAVMGPAIHGQIRQPTATIAQYLEGENASPGDGVFDNRVVYQPGTMLVSGNDRVAACPSTSGGTCN